MSDYQQEVRESLSMRDVFDLAHANLSDETIRRTIRDLQELLGPKP